MSGNDPALEEHIEERLAAADTNAAATLALRGYGPQILGYLSATLRNDDLANEAFATFSEDLWKGLPAFRGASSFRTWAYKLAWHAAVRTTRDPHRRRGVHLATSAASILAEEIRSKTAAHLVTEAKTSVQKLREELTQEEQTLLVLRIDRGLSWNEVAEVMDLEAAVVRKRFERVKEKLRDLARARGLLGS